jgi:hypothetical protein
MHRVDAYEMVRRRTAEAGFKGKLVATCSAPNPTGKGGDYHEALKLARQTAISSSPRARVRARVRSSLSDARSPAALRMRRSRERRRRGDMVVSLTVGPKVTADLVDLGWLPAPDCDKGALLLAPTPHAR